MDSIKDASRITVVAYNISAGEAGKSACLMDDLRESQLPVRIVTNIPGRFARYVGPSSRLRAKSKIRAYLSALDPRSFPPGSRVSLSFENHAKIVMTDRIAFVSSANFSTESELSWECGVLVEDRQGLAAIEAVVDEIERSAVRCYGSRMLSCIAPLLDVHMHLEQASENLIQDVGPDDLDAIDAELQRLRNAIDDLETEWPELAQPVGPITSILDL
ncbi:MAG: hypothetical protein F6K28_56260, partial [Microcoleus sp. SIO2G3]|nr:hypothetical protein [Microcoleus sp. SIO2G3]